MTKEITPSKIVSALEKDFAAFCKKRKREDLIDTISFHAEKMDTEIKISLDFSNDDGQTFHFGCKPYIKSLKQRFNGLSNGEGEEYAVDLLLPVKSANKFVRKLKS